MILLKSNCEYYQPYINLLGYSVYSNIGEDLNIEPFIYNISKHFVAEQFYEFYDGWGPIRSIKLIFFNLKFILILTMLSHFLFVIFAIGTTALVSLFYFKTNFLFLFYLFFLIIKF